MGQAPQCRKQCATRSRNSPATHHFISHPFRLQRRGSGHGDALQTTRTRSTVKNPLRSLRWRYPTPGGTALTALKPEGRRRGGDRNRLQEMTSPVSSACGNRLFDGRRGTTARCHPIRSGGTCWVLRRSRGHYGGILPYKNLNLVRHTTSQFHRRYFACDGLKGTTDTIRHAVTAPMTNVLGGTSYRADVWHVGAITVHRTFTTAKGPISPGIRPSTMRACLGCAEFSGAQCHSKCTKNVKKQMERYRGRPQEQIRFCLARRLARHRRKGLPVRQIPHMESRVSSTSSQRPCRRSSAARQFELVGTEVCPTEHLAKHSIRSGLDPPRRGLD